MFPWLLPLLVNASHERIVGGPLVEFLLPAAADHCNIWQSTSYHEATKINQPNMQKVIWTQHMDIFWMILQHPPKKNEPWRTIHFASSLIDGPAAKHAEKQERYRMCSARSSNHHEPQLSHTIIIRDWLYSVGHPKLLLVVEGYPRSLTMMNIFQSFSMSPYWCSVITDHA